MAGVESAVVERADAERADAVRVVAVTGGGNGAVVGRYSQVSHQ